MEYTDTSADVLRAGDIIDTSSFDDFRGVDNAARKVFEVTERRGGFYDYEQNRWVPLLLIHLYDQALVCHGNHPVRVLHLPPR